MEAFQRILCPTDFSETSRKAFEYAQTLALNTHAEIVLLHVFEVPDFWGSGGHTVDVDSEIKERLTSIRPQSAACKVEYVAHAGQAGEVICWVAQQRQCDLIAMGTHGRTALSHLLLGSIAEYVVRHARCPVLTVRNRPAGEPPLPEPKVHYHIPPLT